MQAVARIPTADAVEQDARHHQQRTGQRRYPLQGLVRIARHRQFRPPAGRSQHQQEIGIATAYRRVGLAMLVQLLDAEQAIAQRLGTAAQLGQGIRFDHQVRVDEGQPRAGRVGHALVVGGSKTGIVRIADETHAGIMAGMPLHDVQRARGMHRWCCHSGR
ncbi:hypothetical protein G6F58_012887 [Rhizopus delemar]|nr:hypothetical protein G6F58_012887 [Rhizopus delemar]